MSEIREDGGTALPRGLVLGYVTGTAATPTRVRKVAARALLIIGLFMVCVELVWGSYQGMRIYELVHSRTGRFVPGRVVFLGPRVPAPAPVWVPAPPPTWNDYLREARYVLFNAPTAVTGIGIAMVVGLPGLLLLILSRGVKRGGRGACIVSAVSVFPIMVVIVVMTPLLAAVGMMPHEPGRTRLLVPALPVGTLAILLLTDLFRYLYWIARNPITEKLPVDFISGKPKAA